MRSPPKFELTLGRCWRRALRGGQSAEKTKREAVEEDEGRAGEAAQRWEDGHPRWVVPSAQSQQHLLPSKRFTSSLRGSPLRYELSLASLNPVRSCDLSQVPSAVSGRIGAPTWGCRPRGCAQHTGGVQQRPVPLSRDLTRPWHKWP